MKRSNHNSHSELESKDSMILLPMMLFSVNFNNLQRVHFVSGVLWWPDILFWVQRWRDIMWPQWFAVEASQSSVTRLRASTKWPLRYQCPWCPVVWTSISGTWNVCHDPDVMGLNSSRVDRRFCLIKTWTKSKNDIASSVWISYQYAKIHW